MKNVKIWLGLAYIIFLGLFLYFLFTYISIEELTSYSFLKSNSEYLINFKQNNIIFTSFVFIIFGIVWISLLQGFGSPLGLICGYIFGPYVGTLIFSLTFALGSSVTFIVANYFFKNYIIEKIQNKYQYLNDKIRNNQLLAVGLLRFLGGIPTQIQNLIPVLFDVKLKNYFFGTLIGMTPQLFIMVSIGSGLEKIIDANNNPPSFFQILFSKDIYLPLIAFLFIIIISFFLKKKLYR